MANTCKTVDIYALHFGDGVYCYVGSSLDHKKRFAQHLKDLKNATHVNYRLIAYCKNQDLKQLKCEVLTTVPADDRLTEEYAWMDKLGATHPLQNIVRSAAWETWMKRPQLARQILQAGQSLRKFNALYPHAKIWKSISRLRNELLALAAEFQPDVVAEVQAPLNELRVPLWATRELTPEEWEFEAVATAVEIEHKYGFTGENHGSTKIIH